MCRDESSDVKKQKVMWERKKKKKVMWERKK